MKTVEDIYRQCEKTGAWCGGEIKHFDQRNFLDDTVLHTVCSWGELDPVRTLVAAGANVNAKGDQGGTPLFNAVIGENPDVISFLLKSGADPRIPNDYKRQVLDYAKNVGAPALIVQLLEKATNKVNSKKINRDGENQWPQTRLIPGKGCCQITGTPSTRQGKQ